MRYRTAAAFRQALEARLLQLSHERNTPLSLFRKLVAFERLLARLMTVSPNDWIVKGGAALVLRAGDDARTTRDLDLGTRGTADAAAHDLMSASSIDLDDYFLFSIIRLGRLLPIEEAAVVRFKVQAELDGRRFEHFAVDVGLDYPSDFRPDSVTFESLLDFAGLPPVEIRAVPLEQHLAEKLHAFSRVYPENRTNTRVRDLVDIILIGLMATFTAGSLFEVMDRTFAAREVQTVPPSTPFPPARWEVEYRRLALEVGLDPELRAGHARAASFLDPILAGTLDANAVWDSAAWEWRAPEAD